MLGRRRSRPLPNQPVYFREGPPKSIFSIFRERGGQRVEITFGGRRGQGDGGMGGGWGGRGDLGHQGEVQNAEGAALIAL